MIRGVLAFLLGLTLMFAVMSTKAMAHDPDHDEHDDWYSSLKRPDVPTMSCCGKADAYFCDDVFVRDNETYCRITDTRDDKKRGNRIHVPVGTEIKIPPEKYKHDAGNPTGHTVVFLSRERFVYCFVQGTGI